MAGYVYRGGNVDTEINEKMTRLNRGDRLSAEQYKQLPKYLQKACRETESNPAEMGVEELREQVAALQAQVKTLEAEKAEAEDTPDAESESDDAEEEESEAPFACPDCEFEGTSERSLSSHRSQAHK